MITKIEAAFMLACLEAMLCHKRLIRVALKYDLEIPYNWILRMSVNGELPSIVIKRTLHCGPVFMSPPFSGQLCAQPLARMYLYRGSGLRNEHWHVWGDILGSGICVPGCRLCVEIIFFGICCPCKTVAAELSMKPTGGYTCLVINNTSKNLDALIQA